jgi:hypothetical protein
MAGGIRRAWRVTEWFALPASENSLFTTARQRLYLSATLGDGGELERVFGRAGIVRLPLPETSPIPWVSTGQICAHVVLLQPMNTASVAPARHCVLATVPLGTAARTSGVPKRMSP